MKKSFFPLVLSAFFCVVMACDPSSDSMRSQNAGGNGGGGVDSGGGNIEKSSPDLVKATVQRAFKLISEPDFRINVVARFYLAYIQSPVRGEGPVKGRLFFPDLPPAPKFPGMNVRDRNRMEAILENHRRKEAYVLSFIDDESLWGSPVLKAMADRKIEWREKGPCPEPENKNADAAVSSLDLSATVCFAVENLTRFEPEDLLANVLALSVHEAAHTAGADEKVASEWQRAFLNYYNTEFGRGFDASVFQADADLIAVLKWAQEFRERLADDPKNPRASLLLGKMIEKIGAIPKWRDPFALYLRNPRAKSIRRAVAYSNSVLLAKQKAEALSEAEDATPDEANELVSAIGNATRNLQSYLWDREQPRCPKADWTTELRDDGATRAATPYRVLLPILDCSTGR